LAVKDQPGLRDLPELPDQQDQLECLAVRVPEELREGLVLPGQWEVPESSVLPDRQGLRDPVGLSVLSDLPELQAALDLRGVLGHPELAEVQGRLARQEWAAPRDHLEDLVGLDRLELLDLRVCPVPLEGWV